VKRLALAALALVLMSAVVVGGYVFHLESLATTPGVGVDEVELEVPKGANARSVGGLLEKTTLVPSATIFRYVVWKRGGLSLKAGKFKLSRSLSVIDLAAALEKPPLAEDEAFVVVEGWRIRDVDEALVATGRCEPGDYAKAASSAEGYVSPFPLPSGTLEGYLYPETYMLPKGQVDARVLVQKQLEQFASRVFTPLEAEVKVSKRSLHQLVTMASMLEREEPVPSNRPVVAGILWKRIDLGYPLGVDATSRYQLKEWNDRSTFLVKLKDQTDPYNTRHKKGLPPTPIGAPTFASLQAALKPTATDFLYYLHDAQKRLHPSRNAEEHEALRKKYDVY
jgi:UPF0755 protein